jgi:hypothetical protein
VIKNYHYLIPIKLIRIPKRKNVHLHKYFVIPKIILNVYLPREQLIFIGITGSDALIIKVIFLTALGVLPFLLGKKLSN